MSTSRAKASAPSCDGELPQLPGEKPTVKDWEDHLSTLFPEVRLKQFLEMRGADMGDEAPCQLRCPRSGSGLLYDDDALEEAWRQVKDWTVEEMAGAAPRRSARTAIHPPFRDCTVSDIASA